MGGPERAAQIDDPDRLAGQRVVDRGGRAPPRVLLAQEVLGREDLDGVVDGERGADGVGPGAVLGPVHALAEHDLVGAVVHTVVALHPEHPAKVVDDHHHVLGIISEAHEAAAQNVDDVVSGELARRSRALRGRSRGAAPAGRDRCRPTPAVARSIHHRPHIAVGGTAHRALPRTPQDARPSPEVGPASTATNRLRISPRNASASVRPPIQVMV